MTGHTTKQWPYALPGDALTDWPAASLELATKLEARASVVTTLPASPVDGDEVFFVHSSGLAIWHLRYRAAATTYKWECIGGMPLYVLQPAVVNNPATGTWYNLVPTLISLPFAGHYEVSAAGNLQGGPASACTMIQTLYLGSVATPAGMTQQVTIPAANYSMPFALPSQVVQVSGSVNLGLAGQGNIVTCAWSNLGVRVMPLRVG